MPTPTPVEISSRPALLSHKRMVVGMGVSIPIAVLSLSGLAFLFFRERRHRIHAEKMTNDACAAAQERERDIWREIAKTKDHDLKNQRLPQELEYVPRGPPEIDSQEVHEATGGS